MSWTKRTVSGSLTLGTGWYGLDMSAIREMEAETASVLEKERVSGVKRGHEDGKEE